MKWDTQLYRNILENNCSENIYKMPREMSDRGVTRQLRNEILRKVDPFLGNSAELFKMTIFQKMLWDWFFFPPQGNLRFHEDLYGCQNCPVITKQVKKYVALNTLTHFRPMFYFYTSPPPWKRQKTFDIFSGYRNGTSA